MQPESDARFCDGCGQSNRVAARFCASCGSGLPTLAPALAPLDRARRLYETGQTRTACALLEKALGENAAHAELRLVYATLLLQQADWLKALAQLEYLRANSPWSPVVEAYIGGVLLAQNRISEAKDTLDEAARRAPKDFYVLLKRGELYCRLGIYLTAVEALERALRIDVEDPVGREAVRRLLRFARDKVENGFVRQLRESRTGFSFKWPWRVAAPPSSLARTDEVWGV